MDRIEKIAYGPYFNETYHRFLCKRRTDTVFNYVAEGILILYEGNPFKLGEYITYNLDSNGNPIK